MEKQFIIPESVVIGLIRYLETRPYKEVAQGIAMLSQLEEAKPTSPDETGQKPSR
jgi:hypothetical protein